MITKDQLAVAMIHECDVCMHLYGKLTPAAFDYRPAPGQRNTLELLRYLAICGIAGMRCMQAGNWKLFGEFSARVQAMPPDGFPAAMEQQKTEIREFFATVSDEVLRTQPAVLPTGVTQPLGAAIVMGPCKWLTAYKMQLFLYAKAAGIPELGTANAWAGADRRP